MIRILGLLSGCLTALLLLYLAASAPAQRVAPADVPAAQTPMFSDAPVTSDIPEPAVAETPALPPDHPVATGTTTVENVAAEPPVETGSFTETPGDLPAVPEVRWHAFWSPFRTAIAANGFVAELQRTTGLDYRVTRRAPGVFEVAFAYDDDADAAEKLALISEASGIDVAAR